jgi:hypothetical protein
LNLATPRSQEKSSSPSARHDGRCHETATPARFRDDGASKANACCNWKQYQYLSDILKQPSDNGSP